jgi:predicted RNA polymerase sigma factor
VSDVEAAITRARHDEWARVIAALTRRFGDLDIAEEAAAETFATAVERAVHPAREAARGAVAGPRPGCALG